MSTSSLPANILTCPSRKSAGVTTNINDGSVPFRCVTFALPAFQHAQYQETDTPNWNAAIVNVIRFAWFWHDVCREKGLFSPQQGVWITYNNNYTCSPIQVLLFARMRMPSVLCPVVETAAFPWWREKYSLPVGASQTKESTIASPIHLQIMWDLSSVWAMLGTYAADKSLQDGWYVPMFVINAASGCLARY